MFKFSLHPNEDHVEVTLQGDLDIDGTEVIEEELLPALENYLFININFEHVPFVDSSGMGLLMNLVHTLQKSNAKVHVVNVKEEVMEVFELLQLPEILGEDVFK
ncbi:STAS domain-containing protein [Metabacillus halosaccharovorans]|uniref:STAS domain-containing protein n=1 Tax=Metabacillus halosaccharovorans TaxID=930124 RepID=UPI00203FDCFA|nr:STAS domain-containing protein [Metabacillus halosaccharovorans]MCM3443394.1 STAS domain-containing protein [Metabacillus halosaccharovorans]